MDLCSSTIRERRAGRTPMFAAALVTAAALLVCTLAADRAEARRGPAGAVALLKPLDGQTERAHVTFDFRRGASAVTLIANGLISSDEYFLRMSALSCSDLAKEPADQRLSRAAVDLTFDRDTGSAFIQAVYQDFRARNLGRAKSIVISGGGNDLPIEACGRPRGIKFADLIVTS